MFSINKILCIEIFFLFLINSSFAQQIIVISASDHSPLSYSSLTNITHPFWISANNRGEAVINAEIGDTLFISHIGYVSEKYVYDGSTKKIISLRQKISNLPPVVIQSCPNYQISYYGNSKMTNEMSKEGLGKLLFGGLSWSRMNYDNVKAAILLNPTKPSILKEFSFWIQRDFQAPDICLYAPLLISFLSVSDSNKLPGEFIYDKSILHIPEKKGRQTIKLDSLNIIIPNEGIYVCFEYVIDPKYEWKMNTVWKNAEDSIGIDTTIVKYGARFEGVYSKGFEIVFYNPIKNLWFTPSGRMSNDDKLHGTIKIDAKLKQCE